MEFMHYSMKTFNWVLVGERLDQCVLNANFSSIGTYFWMLGKDPHGSSNGHLFVWSEVRRVLNYCLPQISASTSWVYRIDDYHVINISKKHLNNALCSNAIFKFALRNRLKINDIGDYIQKTDMNCMIYWCPLKQQFRLQCYFPDLIIKLRELAAYTRER